MSVVNTLCIDSRKIDVIDIVNTVDINKTEIIGIIDDSLLLNYLCTLSFMTTWPRVLFGLVSEYCRNIPPPVCYIFGGCISLDGLTVKPVLRQSNQMIDNIWSNLPSMLTERSHCGVCNIGDSIYVMGGVDGTNQVISTVDRLHLTSMKWSIEKPMPLPKYGFGCVSVGNDIYCIGGFDNAYVDTQSVFRYETKSDIWHAVAPVSLSRQNFSCTLLNNHIYVFGGYGINSCEMFNVSNNRWTEIASMLHERSHSCAVVVNNDNILVLGGRRKDGQQLDTVEEYSPILNRWRPMDWKLPKPRSTFAAWYDRNNNTLYIGLGLLPNVYMRQLIDSAEWVIVTTCSPRFGFGWTTIST
jgi:hypothetical protein